MMTANLNDDGAFAIPTGKIHPWVVRLSQVLAIIAWGTLFAAVVFCASEKEKPLAFWVMGLGWPAIYGLSLAMVSLMAIIATSIEPIGPWKKTQRKAMICVFIPWLNIMILLFPTIAIVVSVLGLVGVLPRS